MAGKGNANVHLTLEERRIIQIGIRNGSDKASIAETLGKDKSTIGKEIKKHRVLKHQCNMPLECVNYRKCPWQRQCTPDCPEYEAFVCKRRDRSPGACNGCEKYAGCRFNKYYYEPEVAQDEYRTVLVDSRVGVNLTTSEAKKIGETVAPLLKQGQSPYEILQAHPELNICEKTLYTYIESGTLKQVSGITAFDLRRQVSRKITVRDGEKYKKRTDKKYLQGRTFRDFNEYMALHPNTSVVQMDTVYNDETKGPFIQTFKFLLLKITLAFYHDTKTAADMVRGIDLLEALLGRELFDRFVPVILTDRGTEFSNADGMETRADGTQRTRVYYCDPMRSNQKGSLENKHIELRYICPKGTDLRALGLTGQPVLNRVLCHLNSALAESLVGKTPFEYTRFLAPEVYDRLNNAGIHEIARDAVILKPYLLKMEQ